MLTVLFDLFGTLVPCYPLRRLSSVLDEMARDIGVSPAAFQVEWARSFPDRLRGVHSSVEANLQHTLEQLGQSARREAIEVAARRRILFERATLVPRPEALTVLQGLRSNSVRVGVVTNCSVETVEAWPGSILTGYIDHVTFSCLAGADKPEPAIYELALAALGSSPADCLFVGDGSCDELAGAERLGMRAILIRAKDDDGSFPGRIDPSDWHGPAITHLSEVMTFLEQAPARITIRNATPLDVASIAKVHVEAWQTAYRGHMPDEHLNGLDHGKRAAMWSKVIERADTAVLVALAGDKLVGFCSSLPSRDADASAEVAEISAIYVDPALFRSGVGSALIDAALGVARQRGFAEVTLWVLTGNRSARAFYEARGFQSDGLTKVDERLGFAIHEVRYRRPANSGSCRASGGPTSIGGETAGD